MFFCQYLACYLKTNEKKKSIKNNILNKQTLLVNTGCVSVEFVLMCNSQYSTYRIQKIDSNSLECQVCQIHFHELNGKHSFNSEFCTTLMFAHTPM